MVKTPSFHCRGYSFNAWCRNRSCMLSAAAKKFKNKNLSLFGTVERELVHHPWCTVSETRVLISEGQANQGEGSLEGLEP